MRRISATAAFAGPAGDLSEGGYEVGTERCAGRESGRGRRHPGSDPAPDVALAPGGDPIAAAVAL